MNIRSVRAGNPSFSEIGRNPKSTVKFKSFSLDKSSELYEKLKFNFGILNKYNFPKNGTVLEIGSGAKPEFGLAALMFSKDTKVTYIDPSSYYTQEFYNDHEESIKDKSGNYFIQSLLNKHSKRLEIIGDHFSANRYGHLDKFDVITLFDVLDDPQSVSEGIIEDALPLLKDNGYLFLSARCRKDEIMELVKRTAKKEFGDNFIFCDTGTRIFYLNKIPATHTSTPRLDQD